jgi:dihydroxyacetone kinase-like predicted kinase
VDDLEELKGRMEEQISAVQTGEVTQAVRTADVDGMSVHQGDIIGLHNGKLVVVGSSVQEVTLGLLARMGTADSSLITIYYGNFVAEAAAENLAESVRAEYADLDVELAYGGQPHYHFILSVE